MISYCEDCKQYWKKKESVTPYYYKEEPNWSYCTIDGIPISVCPMCIKETHEIIKNPIPDSDSNINENNNIKYEDGNDRKNRG